MNSLDKPTHLKERDELEQAIAALEEKRSLLGAEIVDIAITAMAERMDHELVSTVINSLWSRVDKAIHDHGGRIDKHIGDAVMALFGTPTAREDDPQRSIQAAMQIQAE